MIIQIKWLCKLMSINGITIYPFIITNDKNNKILMNHEKIHLTQQKELYVLPFYYLYFKYYFKNRKLFKGDLSNRRYWSYENICFEKEAYENQENLSYLQTRKYKSYQKYIRI